MVIPCADRRTEIYRGSEDGHPRDVENTGRHIATESRADVKDRHYWKGGN